MAKLIDITGKALSGEWGKDDENGEGIPVIRTTNFTNEGIVNYNNVVKRKIEKKNIDEKYLRKGDIIIEKSGGSDKFPVGRVVYFDGDENTYLFNNFTGLLRVKNQDVWYPKYVFYSLFSNYKRGGTRNFENKTTGLHNLKIDDYVSIYEISNINKEEQIYICKTLDSLYGIIKSRELEIQLLDELVKARFVEMFGTIKKEELLGNICEFVTVGIANSATHAYSDSGIPMLRNQNIRENYLDDRDLVYIKPEFASKYESKKLKENDIIIMRTGYPGIACLVPKKYEGCQTFTTLIARLKPNNNPNYICSYINSYFGKKFIELEKVGVAQQNVGAKSLAKMPIKMAPQNLQDEFADFVHQIDKSKVVVFNYIKNVAILLTICSIINENTNGKMGRRLYDN